MAHKEGIMNPGYFFFYTEANIVCILILGLMLLNDRFHGTRQEKQIRFNWTIVVHMLYFISDIGWAAVLSNQLPRTRPLVGLFNLANYILMHLLAYEWFMFMAASEDMPFRKSRRKMLFCRLPVVLSIAAALIAYAADPYFWISEQGELNGLYYPMMIGVPILYMLASFAISMRNANRTDFRAEKQLYRLIGIYPLGIIVSGMIQVFLLNAPLFCFGCTIMMLFFYLQNLQTMVSVDALTRLNNRGQINRYMDQVRSRGTGRITVMMIDIDRFKEINDLYGHAEGDRALILVSEALKQMPERVGIPLFLGRYGGDEFAVFIQNAENDEIPENIAGQIRSVLAEKQQKNRLPYALEVSIGYDTIRDRNDTVEACLVRADEKLYEDKRARAQLRKQSS